jgi:hypothetical protein
VLLQAVLEELLLQLADAALQAGYLPPRGIQLHGELV